MGLSSEIELGRPLWSRLGHDKKTTHNNNKAKTYIRTSTSSLETFLFDLTLHHIDYFTDLTLVDLDRFTYLLK